MSQYKPITIELLHVQGIDIALMAMRNPRMSHEKASPANDLKLAAKLIKAGDEHSKAIRGIVAWFEIDMQIGFMLEWDTYRVGVECLSTSSTMYMDHAGLKGEELAAAKQANLPDVVYHRTVMASYQALRRMYIQRRHHRHTDWQIFCDWVEVLPYFDWLIYPENQ
jgi:hypothetical protein